MNIKFHANAPKPFACNAGVTFQIPLTAVKIYMVTSSLDRGSTVFLSSYRWVGVYCIRPSRSNFPLAHEVSGFLK